MNARSSHWLRILTCGLTCAGALGVAATSSAAGRAVRCEARRGSTLLEDGQLRIYRTAGADLACVRSTGTVLRMAHGLRATSGSVSSIRLAGGFVAWEFLNSTGAGAIELWVIDAKDATARGAARLTAPNEGIGGFVLNARGTLVWIHDVARGCYDSAVNENSLAGLRNLATASSSAGSGCRSLAPPITSLGLSEDGNWAYWRANGTVQGAAIR